MIVRRGALSFSYLVDGHVEIAHFWNLILYLVTLKIWMLLMVKMRKIVIKKWTN